MMKITNMRKLLNIAIVIIASVSLVSCFNNDSPNYQYFPNMYAPVGYETYGDYEIFPGNMEAMLPSEGSIPRGWMPYEYENSTAGLELAKAELKNPLAVTEKNLEDGKELYGMYCSVCHGKTGDGQGILVKREKFLGIPSYADTGRNITEGGIYHVQMFGLNSMGSHASQTNEKERWQITMHVLNLKATLNGEPLLELTKEVSEEVSTTSEEMTTEMVSEEIHSDNEH